MIFLATKVDVATDKSGWTFDMFSGFKITQATWNMSGQYKCEGTSQTETVYFGGKFRSRNITVERRFSFDVQGTMRSSFE